VNHVATDDNLSPSYHQDIIELIEVRATCSPKIVTAARPGLICLEIMMVQVGTVCCCCCTDTGH